MHSQSHIDLIRASAERLSDANFAATNAFYANLFKVAPSIRSLFPDDMFELSEKLWKTIVKVVESADDLTEIEIEIEIETEIETELKALGARHVKST
jgi:hemoglobin-like flavoprotein